jgi:hypothetical protein
MPTVPNSGRLWLYRQVFSHYIYLPAFDSCHDASGTLVQMSTENGQASARSKGDEENEATAAWKYVGYPGLSKWMASSNDFIVLRHFGTLNLRVLLMLQARITRLEKDLEVLDGYSRKLAGGQGGAHSFELDSGSPRDELMRKIAQATKEYSKFTCNIEVPDA